MQSTGYPHDVAHILDRFYKGDGSRSASSWPWPDCVRQHATEWRKGNGGQRSRYWSPFHRYFACCLIVTFALLRSDQHLPMVVS
jgi:hypothetical protein